MHQTRLTVGPDDSMLELKWLPVSQGLLHDMTDLLAVFGREQAHESLVVRHEGFGIDTANPAQLLGPRLAVVRDGPFPAADMRELLRFLQARLTRGQFGRARRHSFFELTRPAPNALLDPAALRRGRPDRQAHERRHGHERLD